MANTPGVPTHNNYRLKAMRAIYPTSGIMAALFYSSASVGPSTAAYSATGEISGGDYESGGIEVDSSVQPAISGNTTYWTPAGNLVFGELTTTNPFNCVQLYDSGDNNISIYVGTFGDQTLTGAPFQLNVPSNGASTALVRWNWGSS